MKGIGSRIFNRHRCLRVSSALSLFAGILISTGCQITIAESTTTLEYRVFPGLGQMDGNWAALLAASDGKVYVGLACHGCSGHLVFYDSVKDKMVDVGDLNSLAGQSGLDVGPQSKIHARFGEGRDGRIYFSTHGGWWFNYARFATPEVARNTIAALSCLADFLRHGSPEAVRFIAGVDDVSLVR